MEQWVKTKVWRMKSTALFVSDIYLTLLFVLKGTMTAKIGTEMEIVQEGQLLIINRHKLCNCFSTEGSIVQVIEIDVEKASRVYPEMNDMIFQAVSLRKDDHNDAFTSDRDRIFLSDCLNLIVEENPESPLSVQGDFILSLLCLEYTIFNNGQGQYQFMSQEKKERLLQILNYIQEHLQDRLTLHQTAKQAKITPQHLSALFKEIFHQSFTDMIMKMRLERAETLLFKSNLSITEIIMECGFSDRKYFYRCFHEAFGCTPLAWRKRWKPAKRYAEELNREAVEVLLPEFRKKFGLFEKPMDSMIYRKVKQLKKMRQKGLDLRKLIVTVDLSETLLSEQDTIQPLMLFGYDQLLRFVVLYELELRIRLPLSFLKETEQAKQCHAVTIESFVTQSLLRFGHTPLTRWRAELLVQNEAEIQEAEKIREHLLGQGITDVSVLF